MSAHTMQADLPPSGMLPESLGKPFVGSVALHAAMVAVVAGYAWWSSSGPHLGAENAGGAAVGVTAVSSIPLPNHGQPNPLANDTKSAAPQEVPEEKPKPKVKEPDPEDAIAIRQSKTKPEKQKPVPTPPKFKPLDQLAPNKIAVTTPQAASSPLFAPVAGAGQIGANNTTLGNRFPGYASHIYNRVETQWGTTTREVDRSIHTAPPVVASFQVVPDGTVRAVRILQRSGIEALDESVRQAIETAMLQPFPSGLKDSYISVELRFELKR